MTNLSSTSNDGSLEDKSVDNSEEDHGVDELRDDSNHSVENFVEFAHKSNCFSGQLVSTNKDGCVQYDKSIGRTDFNCKWLQHKNVMLYFFSDIKTKLAPPV